MLFMKGNISETISSVKKILLRLGRLYLENAKLTVAEKLTVVFSAATLLLIVLVLIIFALAFLSGAILELLAMVLPMWACYLICFGIFIAMVLVILLMRTSLIVNPIARFISRLVFENDRDGDANNENSLS